MKKHSRKLNYSAPDLVRSLDIFYKVWKQEWLILNLNKLSLLSFKTMFGFCETMSIKMHQMLHFSGQMRTKLFH